MADELPVPKDSGVSEKYKNTVAVTVLIVAGVGILGFALLAAFRAPDQAMPIFNTLLPVLGTWVGTVLAYYFSRENFVAASKSVTEMARQVTASSEPGGPSLVRDKMITLKSMIVYPYEGDKDKDPEEIPKNLPMEKLLSLYKEAKKSRLPVLDRQKRPIFVIQWKDIDKYWAGKSSPPTGTLQDTFAENPGMRERFSHATGFVTVKSDDTLGDAKKRMQAVQGCTDAIVTATGTADDGVIGWLTDDMV